MSIPKIEIIQDHDGEYVYVRANDEEIYRGHSVRIDILLDWLNDKGFIKYEEYSFECGEINYGETSYDECPKWVQEMYDEHKENLEGW